MSNKLSSIGEGAQKRGDRSDLKSDKTQDVSNLIDNIITKKNRHQFQFLTDIEKQSSKSLLCEKETLEFIKQ